MSKKAVNKKQTLLARREELLNELKYCERRIQEARSSSEISCSHDADSSDSEIEFNLDAGPSLSELKQQKARLKTCLLATQELTDLTVVQSEVNMLMDPPPCEESSATTMSEDTWTEVMAECRTDLVPFTISFYTQQPRRLFAATSYRNLCVMPTKRAHEKELQQSVLPTLVAPSDALEVIRNYAAEHRARRTTLSQLADKYGDCLFMEQAEEGGFTVRCADLLKLSWTLQNKNSPVARFRHKMKFDLEYMDERYVKTISQAHKALGDPALDTNGRTLLLMKIIDTCLEAKRMMEPTVESQPSDQDSDIPAHPDQIMGPPKSLPKKTKRKDKENITTNDVREERNIIGESSEVKKGETDTRKLKTNPDVEPPAKKKKISVANIIKKTEHIDCNAKQITDKNKEPKSKDNIMKETVATESNVKQIQNQDRNVQSKAATKTDNEKNAKENLIPGKTQQNPKNVANEIKKTENSKVLKLNAKESLKNTSNTNSKPNIVQKSNNIPTLSERFKNKMITNNIVKSSSTNKNTNDVRINKELHSKNIIKTTEKSDKFKINMAALKSKLNGKNKLNQKPYVKNQNILELNSKLNINNNQKARKSPRLKVASSRNVVANKASKIPQKVQLSKM